MRRAAGRPQRAKGKRRKVLLLAAAGIAVCAAAVWAALSVSARRQTASFAALSFQEALAYTTGDRADAVITVGILQDGHASYTVYGENAQVLPQTAHTYEIGSLTKTFTAALVSRALQQGLLRLDATVDQYLSLPADSSCPTVAQLLTHTSGYKSHYLQSPLLANVLAGRNPFFGITKAAAAGRAGKLRLPQTDRPFAYSNFGYAVLGLVLEEVYGQDYTALVNGFAAELGLAHTHISTQDGDLGRCWDWAGGDAYLSAGGLTSDIDDMLLYAQLQLQGAGCFAGTHESLRTLDATPAQYAQLGIRVDEIGMAWIIDSQNRIVWHDGGTGDYNCYLGFDTRAEVAVVILSNLPPDERISATVLGVKLLEELRRQRQRLWPTPRPHTAGRAAV